MSNKSGIDMSNINFMIDIAANEENKKSTEIQPKVKRKYTYRTREQKIVPKKEKIVQIALFPIIEYQRWVRSIRRHSEVNITYYEWANWWLGTGYSDNRKNRNGYKIARIDNSLPYTVDNIYCVAYKSDTSARIKIRTRDEQGRIDYRLLVNNCLVFTNVERRDATLTQTGWTLEDFQQETVRLINEFIRSDASKAARGIDFRSWVMQKDDAFSNEEVENEVEVEDEIEVEDEVKINTTENTDEQ